MLSNGGIDVWESFARWVPHLVGSRTGIVVQGHLQPNDVALAEFELPQRYASKSADRARLDGKFSGVLRSESAFVWLLQRPGRDRGRGLVASVHRRMRDGGRREAWAE